MSEYEIYSQAVQAGKEASQQYFKEFGNLNKDSVGRSWISIRPATGDFVSWLKKQKIGHDSKVGYWIIMNPSGFSGRHFFAKNAGTSAFAEKLAKGMRESGYNEYTIFVECREDYVE